MFSFDFRLHNYSTRSDSLDLRVVNVPKLLCTTYQLKQEMSKLNEERQQHVPFLVANGNLVNEKQFLRSRINELEQELTHLKSQLTN